MRREANPQLWNGWQKPRRERIGGPGCGPPLNWVHCIRRGTEHRSPTITVKSRPADLSAPSLPSLAGHKPEHESGLGVSQAIGGEKLLQAYGQKSSLPFPPEIDKNNWPPSGMENLDGAFKYAIVKTNPTTSARWRFYYGTWLAGRGKVDEAIKILSDTKEGLAKVLLARLLKQKGDMIGARKAFDAISEPWLQIHPQVIIERDKVLRNIGSQTLAEREKCSRQKSRR